MSILRHFHNLHFNSGVAGSKRFGVAKKAELISVKVCETCVFDSLITNLSENANVLLLSGAVSSFDV